MRRHLALLLATVLAVGGALAFAEEGDPTYERGQSERLFLRWTPPAEGTDCGDDRYLSPYAGSDDVVCTQLFATGLEYAFPLRSDEPIVIDALDDIEGILDLGPAAGAVHGVAVMDTTIRITGVTDDGGVTLGTHSEQVVVTPASTATGDASIEFTMDIDDDLDAESVRYVTLTLDMSGQAVLPWDFNLDGDSYFDLPFLVELEEPVAEPTA